ncbi:MAG: YggT family protein [Anaerolineae bacterium]|nr:YggT family protein [Anaerolineae bacterium]
MLGQIYQFVLLARVLISWVQVDPYHPAVQFLYQLTEPVLGPIRRVLPQTMGLDFSPIIAMILVQVLTEIIAATF